MVDIAHSPGFRRNVEQTWGDTGRTWLAELPALSARLMTDWELARPGRCH
ncbi:hypothetical protein [Actinoplanes sp. CA-252034]